MIFNYQAIDTQGIETSGQKQEENQEMLVIALRERVPPHNLVGVLRHY